MNFSNLQPSPFGKKSFVQYRTALRHPLRSYCLPLFLVLAVLFTMPGCGGKNSLLVPGELGITQAEKEKLFRRIDSFDSAERKHAAKVLGKKDPVTKRYLPFLLKVLENGTPSERMAAVNKIGECGAYLTETTDVLCRALGDTEPRVRAAAARSLRQLAGKLSAAADSLEQIGGAAGQGEEREFENLIALSETIAGDIRFQLKRIEDALAAPLPVSRPVAAHDTADEADTDDPASQDENEPSEGEDALSLELRVKIDELDGFSTRRRRNAALAVEWICAQRKALISEHVRELQNRRGETSERTIAADSIETLVRETEGVVSALCLAMEDVDDRVRIYSAAALGTVAGDLAVTVDPLEAAMEEIDEELKEITDIQDSMTDTFFLENFKRSCRKALERVQRVRGESLTALMAQRGISSYTVKDAAAAAVKKIVPGVMFSGGTAEKSEKNQEDEESAEPVEELPSLLFDDKEIRLFLLKHDLESPYVSIARNAAIGLGNMGPDAAEAVPALMKAITNKSNWYVEYYTVREQSIIALGKIGPAAESAIPLLVQLLDRIETEIRGQAAISLGMIGKDAETIVPHLVELLGHAHSTKVKGLVSEALGFFAAGPYSGACYGELLKVLEHSSGDVNLKAFRTLLTYEKQNRRTGLVTWEPVEEYVDGYQVCVKSKSGDSTACLDIGMETALNLGRFSQFNEETHRIEVKARRGLALMDIPWTHVDVEKVLITSADKEADPEIQKQKNEILAAMDFEILP